MSEHVRSQEEIAARVKALESILIEKGIMTTTAIDRLVEIYENEVGPQLGAKVVARAWKDPAFKERLLEDATKACAEFGIGGLQGARTAWLPRTCSSYSTTRHPRRRMKALLGQPGVVIRMSWR